MAISYSGIVNYGKVTLPSVESWGSDMNIQRDPTRSVQTRKIDKVGETSAITSMVDESGDRFCEAINYYARGQNPMVSVSYGQGQKQTSCSKGESFLPYRIARDGAFRPPIWSQSDLLPLSRMPRIWTQVSTQPYKPIFTKRIRDCGTAENTRQVKTDVLKMACVASKTVAAYPTMNQPDVKPGLLRDPLAPGQVASRPSCQASNVEVQQRMNYGPLLLAPTRPATECTSNKTVRHQPVAIESRDVMNPGFVKEDTLYQDVRSNRCGNGTGDAEVQQRMRYEPMFLNPNRPVASGYTNPTAIKESPIVAKNVKLRLNHPNASGYTNPTAIKESPIVAKNVKLKQNHPITAATTNFAAPSLSGYNPDSIKYSRLPERASRGGFEGNACMPKLLSQNLEKNLIKVR
jgi:hypothetical protein